MPITINQNCLLLAKADHSSAVSAAISATTGYTDFSEQIVEGAIDDTRTVSTRRIGGKKRARAFPGVISGTFNVSLQRDDGGTVDPGKFFADIHAGDGTFQFFMQPDRAALTSGMTVTPDASEGNPQYGGTAVVNSINHLSFGSEEDLPSVVTISCTLSDDFARYDS